MTDTSDAEISRMIHAAPFADNTAGIPEMVAMILALQAERKAGWGRWQPIETCPKDGSEILTIRSNGYIAKGVWYKNPFGRVDTVIENESGKWWSVSHWMPLLPTPNTEAKP